MSAISEGKTVGIYAGALGIAYNSDILEKKNIAPPQCWADLEDPRFAGSASGVSDGNAILGHIFGNKDVSRGVAAHAAQSTGIGSSILKQMLPVIASMVMGSLFKGSTGRGLGGEIR